MKRALSLLLTALILTACASAPEEQPDQDLSAATLYQNARAAWQRGDYDLAASRLEALEARYPFGTYAEQAQLDIIYVYHKNEEPASAVAAAERFIRLNPRHPRVDYAWYMKGVARQEQGRGFLDDLLDIDRAARDPEPLRKAFDAFRTLIERYPDSDYVANARERMRAIRDQLAKHEMQIASFYAERKAWVAAANRATHIIREYEGTPAVASALRLLERVYGQLDMSSLRRDVRRVLERNGITAADA